MNYSERVSSVWRICSVFNNKEKRWPTHMEVLNYLMEAHKVKRETAISYIKEALAQGKIKDTGEFLKTI